MAQESAPSPRHGPCAGADVGATLAKLAVRADDGSLRLHIVPSHAIERAAREVERLGPTRLGLTGGGAPDLERLVSLDTVPVSEFEAWHAGARELLQRQGEPPGERDLLVAIGTGTSILLSETSGAARVGGTALGGGTILGLGVLLLGTSDFAEVVALAKRGDRRKVDLLVGDVYRGGDFSLPEEMNASSFAKIARPGLAQSRDPADLADALMALVAEPITVICGALAALTGAERLLFGGSTLRDNAPMQEILAKLGAMGRPVIFLRDGEFAGALGALVRAEATFGEPSRQGVPLASRTPGTGP